MKKRILIYLIVVILTLTILLLIYNPGFFDKIWLWIVGLIGSIVAISRQIWKQIQHLVDVIREKIKPEKGVTTDKSVEVPVISGLNVDAESHQKITLLRLNTGVSSTLGILYYNTAFYCFTLEDFLTSELHNGRLPEGIYHLGFSTNSVLNAEYALKTQHFNGHLMLTEAPAGLTGIIHCGGLGTDFKGDVILLDFAHIQNPENLTSRSEGIYWNLYNLVSSRLLKGEEVILEIMDEKWFNEKFKYQLIS